MIVIDLGSMALTYAILIAMGIFGWSRGFRYMLSIAIFITLGYVLAVQADNFIVDLINRFWTSIPKMFAFILGRNPSDVAAWNPLIPEDFTAPLVFRILVFFSLLLIGIIRAWPWEGKPLSGLKASTADRGTRILGAATGVYIGVIGISAVASFWNELSTVVVLPDLLTAALNGLPTFDNLVPSMIAAFIVVVFILTLMQLPKVWQTK